MIAGPRNDAFLQEQATQMARRRLLASIALVGLLLLALIGTAPLENTFMSDADSQGDTVRQVLVLGLFGMVLFGQVEGAGTRPPMAVPLSIVLLLGYCLLTTLWAIEPMIALRRLILTSVVIWIVVRAVGDLGAVRVLGLLRWLLGVLLVVNFLVVMLSDFGVHGVSLDEAASVAGDWRGAMPHKNTAGAASAITVLLFLFDRKRVPLWLSAVVIVAASFFLVMSNSKTSVVILAISILAGVFMRYSNPRLASLAWPIGLVSAAAVAALLIVGQGSIDDALTDPGRFTGRGAIWGLLIEYARDHPLTGAGFGSFWQIGPASPIFQLTSGWVAKYVGHGHNGYLDLLVTIGVPGLVLAVLVLIVWPAARLLLSVSIARSRRALLAAMLVFCVGHNMSESSILDRAAPVQVFLLITVILIHRLSDQSMGRHHDIKGRLLFMFTPEQRERLKRRLRPPRPAGPVLAVDREEPPAGESAQAGTDR